MEIKNICCIGAGYVGGPTMTVIALKNPQISVTVVDINKDRIDAWNGPLESLPIFEPGLSGVVKETRGRNLFFSTDIDSAIRNAEMIFISVNTPTKTYGEGKGFASDLTYIEQSARHIGRVSNKDKIIVEKSTLPVRTAEKIKEVLEAESRDNKFEVLSNPEFLAEGTAIEDLLNADRVLIGGDDTESGKKAVDTLVSIYNSWLPKERILTTNVWSSELSKLAANAMLAQRISSINSLSALCEKTGADIEELSKAIGMDSRIGPKFLKASVGFGGSCFQKDILNLVYLCRFYGLDQVAEYWQSVVGINDFQKSRFAQRIIEKSSGTINNKKITLLGWAFKKDTNDSRESAAIDITIQLIEEGANVSIYDPKVTEKQIKKDLLEKSKKVNLQKIDVFNNPKDAIKDSFGVAIITEWDEFKSLPWDQYINQVNRPANIFDGRNIFEKEFFEKIGYNYYSIGK
jgi:UDPglucose 6-dehydrogenase